MPPGPGSRSGPTYAPAELPRSGRYGAPLPSRFTARASQRWRDDHRPDLEATAAPAAPAPSPERLPAGFPAGPHGPGAGQDQLVGDLPAGHRNGARGSRGRNTKDPPSRGVRRFYGSLQLQRLGHRPGLTPEDLGDAEVGDPARGDPQAQVRDAFRGPELLSPRGADELAARVADPSAAGFEDLSDRRVAAGIGADVAEVGIDNGRDLRLVVHERAPSLGEGGWGLDGAADPAADTGRPGGLGDLVHRGSDG